MEIFRSVTGRYVSAVVLSVAVSLLFGLFGFHATAQTVGSNLNFFAESQNPISSATGSFDSVTGVMSETAAGKADNFSLQLNTNVFDTSACQNSPYSNPSKPCRGWEQFVFSNKNYSNDCGTPQNPKTCVYIQYWLLNYGQPCPQGFKPQGGSPSTLNCFQNGAVAFVPDQTIAKLSQMKLIGQVNAGGQDNVIFSVGTTSYPGTAAADSILSLGQEGKWTQAEFNVFGGCCASQATFNASSTIVARLSIDNATAAAPYCSLGPEQHGATGETNNLSRLSPCCRFGGLDPAIVFTESNTPGAESICGRPWTVIAVCNLACFNSLYGQVGRWPDNPVTANDLLQRMDATPHKPEPFAAFEAVQSHIVGPMFIVHGGTIESVKIQPADHKSGAANEATTIVVISPGSTVLKSGELGGNVKIVEAGVESSKRDGSFAKLRAAWTTLHPSRTQLPAAPSAKPRIVGMTFNDGTPSSFIIARDVSPPEALPAK
jgi:hypothetical protein